MDMTPQAWPDWYDGRHINEVLFCQQFLDKHPMKCVRGRLFTVDGLIEDEGQIGNLILEEISGVLTSGLSKVVTNLLASIKLQAYSPPLPIEADRIHVANGTYFMDGSFTPNKSYCNNRLTVSYNPDATAPAGAAVIVCAGLSCFRFGNSLLPARTNLPPAALFAAMTRCSTSGHFLFYERETEKERTR